VKVDKCVTVLLVTVPSGAKLLSRIHRHPNWSFRRRRAETASSVHRKQCRLSNK